MLDNLKMGLSSFCRLTALFRFLFRAPENMGHAECMYSCTTAWPERHLRLLLASNFHLKAALHPYDFTVIANYPTNKNHAYMKCLAVENKLSKLFWGKQSVHDKYSGRKGWEVSGRFIKWEHWTTLIKHSPSELTLLQKYTVKNLPMGQQSQRENEMNSA